MPKGFGNGHANGMGEQQLTQSKKLNAFTEKIQGSSMKQGKVNDVMVKRMGSMTSSLLKLRRYLIGNRCNDWIDDKIIWDFAVNI